MTRYVEIATTRPETLLGDTAVAVHPGRREVQGPWWARLLILPLVGREIPVIADEYVDKEFGTGCVKITPAHDPNDFEVGLSVTTLEQIKVLNDDATINSYGGKYEGMDRYAAREAMVEELGRAGVLLVKVVPHKHNVGQCYRCGTTVEPLTSKQWFVKMKPLAEPALEAVLDGTVKLCPRHGSAKTYYTLDGERARLVHLASALVGSPHSGVTTAKSAARQPSFPKRIVSCLPQVRGRRCSKTPTCWTRGSARLCGRSRHLGWPDKRPEDLDYFYPDERCWLRGMT